MSPYAERLRAVLVPLRIEYACLSEDSKTLKRSNAGNSRNRKICSTVIKVRIAKCEMAAGVNSPALQESISAWSRHSENLRQPAVGKKDLIVTIRPGDRIFARWLRWNLKSST